MKSKIIILIILFFFNFQVSLADEYNFEVSKIEVKQKGNVINAFNGKITSNTGDLEIYGNKFIYVKNVNYLEATDGYLYLKKEKLKVKFNQLVIKNNNILTASGGVKIEDSKNSLEINAQKIILNRNDNILTASGGVKIEDSKNSLEINAQKIILNRNENILTASKSIKIYDLNNSIRVDSETIILDRSSQTVESPSKSILIDKYKNIFQTSKFQYNFKKKE